MTSHPGATDHYLMQDIHKSTFGKACNTIHAGWYINKSTKLCSL